MKAKKLYEKLDKDFELSLCRDDWSRMDFNEFISLNFKKRCMGILLDNSSEIDSVYTTVFPSENILKQVLKLEQQNILIITHHPMVWDIKKTRVFEDINSKLLPILKEQRVSIYTLHVPLDKNSEYSTTTTLAKALDVNVEGEFYEYFGVKVGLYGNVDLKTPEDLAKRLSLKIGHKTKLWKYGSNEIKHQKVALVAGGGNEIEVLQEIINLGINTFVTGVTILNEYSKKIHEFEKENKINLIGGTHYSTEKFACMALCRYFEDLGLNCEFLEDTPMLEDLE